MELLMKLPWIPIENNQLHEIVKNFNKRDDYLFEYSHAFISFNFTRKYFFITIVIVIVFVFVLAFLKHAPCMQKVQTDYELCSKRYQQSVVELESKNKTKSSENIKSVCW